MSYEFRKKSELLRKKCNIRQIRIRFGNVYKEKQKKWYSIKLYHDKTSVLE